MTDPLVTIGVIVSDGQPVRTSMDALLAQTYANLEVLVCDMTSTNAVMAVCAEYAARDRRVKYLSHERDGDYRGSKGTFRRLVSGAAGEYFMWASAKDYRGSRAVEDCVEALQRNPGAVMAHGAIDVTSKGGSGSVTVTNQMDLTSSSLVERVRMFTTHLQHPGMFYGLFNRHILARMAIGNHAGYVYVTCLQACLHGPIEYVRSPIIQYHQPTDALDTSMYTVKPITLKDLLTCRNPRRYKCWVTLFMGCRRVLAHQQAGPVDRISGTLVFAKAFVRRYSPHLGSELVFLLLTPVQWTATLLLRARFKFKPAR